MNIHTITLLTYYSIRWFLTYINFIELLWYNFLLLFFFFFLITSVTALTLCSSKAHIGTSLASENLLLNLCLHNNDQEKPQTERWSYNPENKIFLFLQQGTKSRSIQRKTPLGLKYIVSCEDLRIRLHASQSQLCHLPAMWALPSGRNLSVP